MALNKCPRCNGPFVAQGDVCDLCRTGRAHAAATAGTLRAAADADVRGTPYPASPSSGHRDEKVAEHLAALQSTMDAARDAGRDPVDVLRAAADDDEMTARAAVAAHPGSPPELLDRLANDQAHVVRLHVARNRNTASETLGWLADPAAMSDPEIMYALADNPSLTRWNRERLYQHGSRAVRDRAKEVAEELAKAKLAEREREVAARRFEAEARRAEEEAERKRLARPVTDESYRHGEEAVARLKAAYADTPISDKAKAELDELLDHGLNATRQIVEEDGLDGNELHDAIVGEVMFPPFFARPKSEAEAMSNMIVGQVACEIADHAQGRMWTDDDSSRLTDEDREVIDRTLGGTLSGYTAVTLAAFAHDTDNTTGIRGRVADVIRGREGVPKSLFGILENGEP